jgi:chaperonin GroEL (HSP60 family)
LAEAYPLRSKAHKESFQDVVAGDGTTSVVVICGALLKKAQELLERGVHPTVISDSFNAAVVKACEVGSLQLLMLI